MYEDTWVNRNAPLNPLDAYRQGRADHDARVTQENTRNALMQYGTDPRAALQAAAQGGNVTAWNTIRGAANADQTAQLLHQKAQFDLHQKSLEQAAGEAYALRNYPYEVRMQQVQAKRQQYAGQQLSPEEQAVLDDPSDINIDRFVGRAMSLKEQIDARLKERNTDSLVSARTAQATERERHNRTQEGFAGARVGIAQHREGRIGAGGGHRSSGGHGNVPPPPPGFVVE